MDSAPCHTRVRVFDCNFFWRLAKDTDIGLGESYMKGEFEPDDLTNFLNVMVQVTVLTRVYACRDRALCHCCAACAFAC